jgi:hypothetical protein
VEMRNQGVSKWPCSVLLSECSRQYGFLSCWARRFLARAIISGPDGTKDGVRWRAKLLIIDFAESAAAFFQHH